MKSFLLALDRFGNWLVGGSIDEYLSSHAYRMWLQRKPMGVWKGAIDRIFGDGHCEESWRRQMVRGEIDT